MPAPSSGHATAGSGHDRVTGMVCPATGRYRSAMTTVGTVDAATETVIIVHEQRVPPADDAPKVPQSVVDLQTVLDLMAWVKRDLSDFSKAMPEDERQAMLQTTKAQIDESIRFLNAYIASPDGALSDAAAAARNMALSVYLAVDEAERNNSDEYPQRMLAGVADARTFIRRAAHPVDAWVESQIRHYEQDGQAASRG